MWAKLGAVKNRFNMAMSSYMTLVKRIGSDATWRWAKGFDLEELEARKVQLDLWMDRSEFWKSFAVHEAPELRKKFVEAAASREMKFVCDCEAMVKALEQKTKQLTNMHNARVSTGN